MECEVCGNKIQRIFITEIEEVVLRLCEECSKSGRVLNIVNVRSENKPKVKVEVLNYDEEYELVEEYGKLISEARNKAGLSIEDLASKIGEKSSVIRKIEREEIRPSDKIVEKIEKILKIKLREKVKVKVEKNREEVEAKLRIADVVEIKD